MSEDEFKKLLAEQTENLTKQFDWQLHEALASLYGQLSKRADARVEELENELTGRMDRLQSTVDGIVQRLETDDLERLSLSQKVDRHEGWIEQLADTTDTKLVAD